MIDGSGWTTPSTYVCRQRAWYKSSVLNGVIEYGDPYLDLFTSKIVTSVAGSVKNSGGR